MYTFQQQQMIQEQEQVHVPCVEFSAMGFDHQPSRDNSFASAGGASCQSDTSMTVATAATNLSGWGSAVSRKSYACLKTLGEMELRKSQLNQRNNGIPRQPSQIVEGEAWGYFVDTVDP